MPQSCPCLRAALRGTPCLLSVERHDPEPAVSAPGGMPRGWRPSHGTRSTRVRACAFLSASASFALSCAFALAISSCRTAQKQRSEAGSEAEAGSGRVGGRGRGQRQGRRQGRRQRQGQGRAITFFLVSSLARAASSFSAALIAAWGGR